MKIKPHEVAMLSVVEYLALNNAWRDGRDCISNIDLERAKELLERWDSKLGSAGKKKRYTNESLPSSFTRQQQIYDSDRNTRKRSAGRNT
jgi:hypothetical protein